MKYIIFKVKDFYHPVLFAEHTTHKQVTCEGGIPISAGFVSFTPTYRFPKCYGKSESLKLDSNPERDSEIIRKFLDGFNMMSFYEPENEE